MSSCSYQAENHCNHCVVSIKALGFALADPITERRDLDDNMQHSVMYSMLLNAKSYLVAEG